MSTKLARNIKKCYSIPMSSGLGPNQVDLRAPVPDNFYNPALRAAELLHERVYRDSLTGLLNREGVRLVTDELATQRIPAFLAVVDIDDVKPINDAYGHEVGDALFVEVGERLQASLRTGADGSDSTDIVARGRQMTQSVDREQREHAGRIGGDEFIGIMPVPVNGNTHSVYHVLLERLSSSLTFRTSDTDRLAQVNPPRTIHASFGLAFWDPNRGVPVGDSLRIADQKMYAAKAHFKSELHP